MPRTLLSLLVVVVVSAHPAVSGQTEDAAATEQRVRTTAKDARVIVTLQDGSQVHGSLVTVRDDFFAVIELDSQRERQIRYAEVLSFQVSQTPSNPSEIWRMDIFGGYSALSVDLGEQNEEGEDVNTMFHGVGGGVTARFIPGLPWLGITGAVSQNWKDDVRFTHYRVGPSVTSSYTSSYFSRGFAYALFGRSRLRLPDAPSESVNAINVGAGLDMFAIVRLQFDWVRMDLPGYPSNNLGFFAGVVIPLCIGKDVKACFEVD